MLNHLEAICRGHTSPFFQHRFPKNINFFLRNPSSILKIKKFNIDIIISYEVHIQISLTVGACILNNSLDLSGLMPRKDDPSSGELTVTGEKRETHWPHI